MPGIHTLLRSLSSSGSIVVLMIVLVGLVCCSNDTLIQPISNEVELRVFSGRPNPVWSLDAEAVATLESLVAALPHGTPPQPAEQLGYGGFVVHVVEGEHLRTYYVGAGAVEVVDAQLTTTYLDPDHRIADWLLETGEFFLPATVYETVQTSLGE